MIFYVILHNIQSFYIKLHGFIFLLHYLDSIKNRMSYYLDITAVSS